MPTDVPSVSNFIKNDLPLGPLTCYRKQSTFCWRKMQVFLESEDIINYKVCFSFILLLSILIISKYSHRCLND